MRICATTGSGSPTALCCSHLAAHLPPTATTSLRITVQREAVFCPWFAVQPNAMYAGCYGPRLRLQAVSLTGVNQPAASQSDNSLIRVGHVPHIVPAPAGTM